MTSKGGVINLRMILIILVVLILGSGAFLAWQLFGSRHSKTNKPINQQTNQPITLNFWGVFDDASVFQPIIDNYQKQHPNVKIQYTHKEPSLYEFASLNLLASQDGPDVWLIPHSWLPKHADKFQVVPEGWLASQNLPAQKKRLFQKPAVLPTNVQLYKQLFAPVTAENNLSSNQVLTIPMAVDTLGLYANVGALQQAEAKSLPTTWEDVLALTKKLAKRSSSSLSLDQPAIGLGASQNIGQASDILATLMIQNSTQMVSPDKQEALFNKAVPKATGEATFPGTTALDFYTSFASPTKENFSWSAEQPNDYELFQSGRLPLLIDYSFRIRDLTNQNPGLVFATGALPQIAGTTHPTSLANATVVGVPKVSRNSGAAWDFIKFLTREDNSLAYAHASGRPPARVNLLSAPGFDGRLAPFIAQVPTASTWYRNEVNKTNQIFHQAIDAVLAGQPLNNVIDRLTKQMTHILRNESYD